MAAKKKRTTPAKRDIEPAVMTPWVKEKMKEKAIEQKAIEEKVKEVSAQLDDEDAQRLEHLVRLGMEAEKKEAAQQLQELERALTHTINQIQGRDGEQEWWMMQADHEQKMRELREERMRSMAASAKVICATSTVMACASMFMAVIADSLAAGLMVIAFAGLSFGGLSAYQHYHTP